MDNFINLQNFAIIFMVTCLPYKEIDVGANWVQNAKLKFYQPHHRFLTPQNAHTLAVLL